MKDERIKLPIFSQAARFNSNRNVKLHSHPGVEIILVTSGNGEISFEGNTCPLTKGDLIILAPETEHNQVAKGKLSTLFVVFEENPGFFDYSSRIINVRNDKIIEQFMKLICSLSESMNYEYCDGIIFSLLKRIKQVEKNRRKFHEKDIHQAIDKAVTYIDEHFASDISLNEIAAQSGVSQSYLKALFIKELGIAPKKYLQNIRMGHARKILQNPYLYIEEIAVMCGYKDANYFARAFRKTHKCTPSEYREFIKNRPPDNYTIRH